MLFNVYYGDLINEIDEMRQMEVCAVPVYSKYTLHVFLCVSV